MHDLSIYGALLTVVLLFAQLPSILDTVDSRGDVALDLALQERLQDMAATLVKYGASVNLRHPDTDATLLHTAISRGLHFILSFLKEPLQVVK